jgi:pimeloyl-ACP methyl ester carboxylesterase
MQNATRKPLTLFHEQVGTGKPLVFLSGLGGDHRSFTLAIKHFSKRWHVVAFDNCDSGCSPRCDTVYTTVDMANDVAHSMGQLGLSDARVVGHSLGGMVAQELALNHPNLVASMLLVSSHAGANPWRQAVVESWIYLRHRSNAAEFARAVMPWLVAARFFQDAPAQVEGLVRFAERNEHPQDSRAFERQARAAMYHESGSRLSRLSIPCLVLAGDQDLLNPPVITQSLADAIPGSRLHLMKGVGHLPHVEASPDFIAAITDFLTENIEARRSTDRPGD